MIQSPYDALTANSCMTLEVASIRLTAEIGLPTILADSEDGLSIQEISEKTGVDSLKLGPSSSLSYGKGEKTDMLSIERVLRLLVTQGWFREPRQGYFANNRLSNLIKKDQAGYHIATYMLVSRSSTITHFLFNFYYYYCFIIKEWSFCQSCCKLFGDDQSSRYRISKEHGSFPYCLPTRFQHRYCIFRCWWLAYKVSAGSCEIWPQVSGNNLSLKTLTKTLMVDFQ